jgi:hypothetical protein
MALPAELREEPALRAHLEMWKGIQAQAEERAAAE